MSSPTNIGAMPIVATSSICLGNYLPQATKFKIIGSQGGRIQTIEIVVKPFSFQWSEGWETGMDKMVNVETKFYAKSFGPFIRPVNFALFR